jgi:hypothetical protein
MTNIGQVYNDLLAAVPDSEHIVDFAFFIHKRYKNLKSMYSGDVKALNGVSAAAETVGINFAQERIDRYFLKKMYSCSIRILCELIIST